VRLLRAAPQDHRLSLARGVLEVTVDAPPRLFFVETPVASDDLEGLARVATGQPIPIAAGEWLTTRFEFADLMDGLCYPLPVTTTEGVVTLTGAVDSDAIKSKVEQDAKSVEGVKSVVNNLTVKPPPPIVFWSAGAALWAPSRCSPAP
jgi:hypothetical protein